MKISLYAVVAGFLVSVASLTTVYASSPPCQAGRPICKTACSSDTVCEGACDKGFSTCNVASMNSVNKKKRCPLGLAACEKACGDDATCKTACEAGSKECKKVAAKLK